MYPLPDEVYERLALQVYTPILLKENVILALPPLFGKDHAVRFMWERRADRSRSMGSRENAYIFGHVPLAFGSPTDPTPWIIQFLQALTISLPAPTTENFHAAILTRIREEDRDLVFFVNIPETLPQDQLTAFLHFVQTLYYLLPERIHFILVIDQHWDERKFITLLSPFRSLAQHVVTPPLFTDRDVRHFVRYWASKWNVPVSADTEDTITQEAGGILLLAKAAVRLLAQNAPRALPLSHLFRHPEYTMQVQLFAARLTPRQLEILKSPPAADSEVTQQEAEHLRNMHVLELTPHGYHIRSRSLRRFLSPKDTTPTALFVKLNDQAKFSRTEQAVLKLFLTSNGRIVTREQLATVLHGGTGEPTDWAIDQAVSRLRKKLMRTEFSAYGNITTKKGKGFVCLFL